MGTGTLPFPEEVEPSEVSMRTTVLLSWLFAESNLFQVFFQHGTLQAPSSMRPVCGRL
jgi:hypothetical protein